MKKEELKYILVRTDGTYSIVEISDDTFLEQAYKLLDCELIESVHIGLTYIMIIDESGKLKDKEINVFCTALYNGCCCGDYIVGEALLARYNGPDIVGLTSEEINTYVISLERLGYENKCS